MKSPGPDFFRLSVDVRHALTDAASATTDEEYRASVERARAAVQQLAELKVPA